MIGKCTLSCFMQERVDFTSFILSHIVRERMDSSAVIIRKNTNLDDKLRKAYNFLGHYLRNCMLSFVLSSRLLYSLTVKWSDAPFLAMKESAFNFPLE